jgi:hypothetical protein
MSAGITVQIRLSDKELDAIDDYRREQRNPPSRPRAIRELARAGLMSGEAMKSDDQPPVPAR